jgi:hypothetical protein
MDILQPAPGATNMGHLKRAVRVTGFVIKWGARLATLEAGMWMLHGMVVIKIQADKKSMLHNNHIQKREGKEENAHLMDIYSFPGYQVEVEVATNINSSSKPVILEAAIKDVMDPVILGDAGVSVYEIPAEKVKLPVDDWVDVEDLGLDDNTHPSDTDPVEMATPAPSQKVWLASDVNRVNPVPYGKAVTTTGRLDLGMEDPTERSDVSTAETPRMRPTKRQGRSFMAEGELIAEANVGTIPYMAMWVLFLCALLSTLCHPAMALLDHDRQVVAYDCGKPTDMQAYDIGERNHWCDLNPLMDLTNTDITMTNVLYVLLQKVPRVRIKIRTCKIVQTVVPLYCGHYDHQTFVTPLAERGVPSKVPVHHCQQYWLNKEYISQVASRHPLQVNATTIVLVETKGRTWVTEEGEVKCKGEKFDYEGKHYEDLVICHQLAITLVEDTALINLDGTLTTNQEEIILDCKDSDNACATAR